MSYKKAFNEINSYIFSVKMIDFVQCKENKALCEKRIPYHCILFVSKGSGVCYVNQEKIKCKEGTLIVFSPRSTCTVKLAGKGLLEYYMIYFSFATAYENNNQWEFENEKAKTFPFEGALTIQCLAPIVRTLENMYRSWNIKGKIFKFHVRLMFYQFIYDVMKDIRRQEMNGDICRTIEQILEYISYQYYEPINLQKLSEMAGMSTSYFSKNFKQYVGISPIEYLTKVRIEQAKKLLIYTEDIKIKDIAKSVGYQDEFYFSNVFKKIEGCSPTEFINKQGR